MAPLFQDLRFELQGPVAVVTLDRPPVNALSRRLYAELVEVFEQTVPESGARVAILTAAGTRAFCAGIDVKEAAGLKMSVEDQRLPLRSLYAIRECLVPVIGAINGPCLGGGLAMAALCDYLIAAEHATFGLPEVKVGLLGGAKFLLRLVPPLKARAMMFSGEPTSARELMHFGSVEAVVPAAELPATALAHANRLAAQSALALRLAKRGLNHIEYMPLKDAYEYEQSLTETLGLFPEAQAARSNFGRRSGGGS